MRFKTARNKMLTEIVLEKLTRMYRVRTLSDDFKTKREVWLFHTELTCYRLNITPVISVCFFPADMI